MKCDYCKKKKDRFVKHEVYDKPNGKKMTKRCCIDCEFEYFDNDNE